MGKDIYEKITIIQIRTKLPNRFALHAGERGVRSAEVTFFEK